MARVPAFAVTDYGQERDVSRAKNAGFLYHFVKPVDITTLDKHIREALGVIEASP
jgi:CheY-like chemotaxis protein